MSPELTRILEAGNQAPSGENCQPWRFVVHGTVIDLYLRPERDQSAYGWGQRASYLACGAVLENIAIAATSERMRADIALFPNAQEAWHIAKITLTPDETVLANPLAAFISRRISNRKPYAKEALTSEQRTELLAMGQIKLIEKEEDIQKLARVGSTNEEIMLANKSLHNFFFSHVSWTKEEDEKDKIGFYIKTLELPPPAEKMFKVFSNWSVMRVLAGIGFNRVVAKQNAATNAAVSAIGAISIAQTEPIDFVNVGRTVERTWLTATSLGLSFQPLTGVLFFKLKIDGGEGNVFSAGERKNVLDAYAIAAKIIGTTSGHLAFMFRVGRADAPSAHAIRFPLKDVVSIT